MKVKDFIKQLQGLDQEAEVIMSKDGEGNGYSPYADLNDEMVYIPDSTWSGDVAFPELTEELKKDGYTEEDVYQGDDAIKAVILYPIN